MRRLSSDKRSMVYKGYFVDKLSRDGIAFLAGISTGSVSKLIAQIRVDLGEEVCPQERNTAVARSQAPFMHRTAYNPTAQGMTAQNTATLNVGVQKATDMKQIYCAVQTTNHYLNALGPDKVETNRMQEMTHSVNDHAIGKVDSKQLQGRFDSNGATAQRHNQSNNAENENLKKRIQQLESDKREALERAQEKNAENENLKRRIQQLESDKREALERAQETNEVNKKLYENNNILQSSNYDMFIKVQQIFTYVIQDDLRKYSIVKRYYEEQEMKRPNTRASTSFWLPDH